MGLTSSIVDQVTELAGRLSPAERLEIIRALASPRAFTKGSQSIDPTEFDRQLAVEEETWYCRPKADRMRFAGEYVAVVEGEVIDHDVDQSNLVLRTRNPARSVLIVFADWDAPPVYSFPSTRLSC
jgi:hypothetical protein